MRLAVESLGEGPDLVMLHGWGMNAGVWAPIAEILSNHWRLHLVDLPGHGASDHWGDEASLSDWADSVLSTVPSGAIWVGWSLGAQVALRAALDSADDIERLVLVAGTPRFVSGADWSNAMAAKVFAGFAANLASDHGATLERFLSLQIKGSENAGETLRWLRREIHERPAPRDEALDVGLRLLLETDLRGELAGLQQPALWLLGERDTLVPVGVGHDIEALRPDDEVLIVGGAAHAPFLSHGPRCVSLMRHFLLSDVVHA